MERVDGGRHKGCAIATTAGLESCVQSRAMSHVEVESLERVIWPEDAARRRRCRELWASENFRYGDAEHPEWGRVGLVQVNNGPCGVLAAIQARAISRLIVAHEGRTRQASATTEHLVEALATCLEDAATTESVGDTPQLQRCCVVLPTAPPEGHSCFCLKEASGCGLRSVLAAHIDSFDLVALLRSLVATRGAERVAAELRESGELCLVVGDSEAQLTGQMGFCSESLLMLCITGCANNALDPDPPPRSPPQIGITAEPGLPGFFVGPWLKNPDRPVWVLRWGAHYSCVWRDSKRLWHYNGAAGARAFDSVLVGEDEVSNEQQGMNTELAGRGKVLTLIQRRPVAELDSRSEIHVLWEVAPQPQKLYPEPEPEFEEPSASGDKWYCKKCYIGRGLHWAPNWNEPNTTLCGACGRHCCEATERSVWVNLRDLSVEDQALAQREWAGSWQQVLWAACGNNWRVAGEHSSSMHL